MNALIQSYPLQPVNLVEIVFFSVCLLGILLLWRNERFRGICLLFGFEAALMLFNFSEETQIFNQQYLITPAFSLCTGPAFYLFVRHLVVAKLPWDRSVWWHFLPAGIALFFTSHTSSVIVLGSISLVIYGVLAYRWLQQYRQASQAMTSAAKDMQLGWLITLMILFAILGLTDIVRLNLQQQLGYELFNTWYLAHQFCVLLLYISLLSLALRQPLLFDGLSSYEPINPVEADTDVYQTLFEQIDKKLIASAMYRQPRLSLHEVAQSFSIGVKDVSSAINIGAGLSFCDYINGLRIAEVKRRLKANDAHQTNLLSIGLEAGFNSKSSFNAVFKSAVGQTPRQFRQENSPESRS